MWQIKMFYIGTDVEEHTERINAFLREKGNAIHDVQMMSNLMPGGDTMDAVMIIYKE